MMKVVRFSEMSVNFYQTTRCHSQKILFVVAAARASNLRAGKDLSCALVNYKVWKLAMAL
jgi:hypothetical protein